MVVQPHKHWTNKLTTAVQSRNIKQGKKKKPAERSGGGGGSGRAAEWPFLLQQLDAGQVYTPCFFNEESPARGGTNRLPAQTSNTARRSPNALHFKLMAVKLCCSYKRRVELHFLGGGRMLL